MYRRVFRSLVTLLALLLAVPAVAQDSGRFVTVEKFASSDPAIAPTRVTIWLPPGYDAGERRYGVLYMHDGQNLFDPARSNFNKVWAADKAAMRLVAAKRIDPVIIVGIDHPGKDRTRQYMPAKPLARVPGFRPGMEAMTGRLTSDAYLEWLATELKPAIDRDYRTLPGAAHTAIAGSSMGGLVSAYAFVEYPKVFGRAAAISSHWPVMEPKDGKAPAMAAPITAMWTGWLADGLGKPAGRRIWFDHGTATLDQWYAPYQQAIDAQMIKSGWKKGRDFESRVYPGAAHEENAWAARLDDILGWLLRK